MGRKFEGAAGGVLIAGTTSDAGKSFVATGLGRVLVRRGWTVRPFKAVNMSLNSVPTEEGDEIALAQWVQARAARSAPTSLANPVLLKPRGRGVEVIVRGRARWHLGSWRREMPRKLPALRAEILAAIEELRATGAFVVAEGAGSPAEVNLRASDLANFFVAEHLDVPVLLVADLERGGALAQVVGTYELLAPRERRRLRGIIFNRLRGDPEIFRPARRWIEDRLGVPVVGVLRPLPARAGLLPPEDSLQIRAGPTGAAECEGRPQVGVLRLPHAANFSDFSSLERSTRLAVRWVEDPKSLPALAALLLPGSRRTREDLAWMDRTGWTRALPRALRRGLGVGGVCGGYQMMGTWLDDPSGFEGSPGRSRGLGLLSVRTIFRDPKVVRQVTAAPVQGRPWGYRGAPLAGYEVHRGRSIGSTTARPIFEVRPFRGGPSEGELEGAASADGRRWGTVLHGVLDHPAARTAFERWVIDLATASKRPSGPGPTRDVVGKPSPLLFPGLDRTIDHVADLLESDLDLRLLGRILGRRIAP